MVAISGNEEIDRAEAKDDPGSRGRCGMSSFLPPFGAHAQPDVEDVGEAGDDDHAEREA
jgi:hypothetical protein